MTSQSLNQARELLWMLGRLYPDKHFELDTDLAGNRRWPIEEHDLNELPGNLLDNADKWVRSCVVLTLDKSDSGGTIVVSDDGNGVPQEELVDLGLRGARLDEQTPGYGLGSAIVREIAERYGGTLTLTTDANGSLEARVALPLVFRLVGTLAANEEDGGRE